MNSQSQMALAIFPRWVRCATRRASGLLRKARAAQAPCHFRVPEPRLGVFAQDEAKFRRDGSRQILPSNKGC